MKSISLLLFTFISIGIYAQQYNFHPKWKKGEIKKVKVKEEYKTYENDSIVEDSVTLNEVRIEVLKEEKDHYEVEFIFKNQALKISEAYYENMEDDLIDFQDLRLIYWISKENGDSELMNWEEASNFMNESLGQISDLLMLNVPEMAPIVELTLMPLMENFKSKEKLESYMESSVEYLLIPYSKPFDLGTTITEVESEENPFNPSLEISATILLTLKSVDLDRQESQFEQVVELDMSQFTEMIKSMMLQIAESFEMNDSLVEVRKDEISNFEMKMESTQDIYYNMESSWVTKAIGRSIITGMDPKDGTRKRTEITITRTVQ